MSPAVTWSTSAIEGPLRYSDRARERLITEQLKTAGYELLQGGPFTDSRRPAMAREKGAQSLAIHLVMHGQRLSSSIFMAISLLESP